MADNDLTQQRNFNGQTLGQNGVKEISGTPTAAGVLFGVIHLLEESVLTSTNNCGKGDNFTAKTLPAGYYYGRWSAVSVSSGSAIAYYLS
jgi:hypothetical protein